MYNANEDHSKGTFIIFFKFQNGLYEGCDNDKSKLKVNYQKYVFGVYLDVSNTVN